MKFADIQRAIYNWFTDTTNVQAIWAEQEGPRPPRPYASLKLITGPVKTNGIDDMQYVSDGKYSLKGDRRITCSINVFGTDAHDILALARDSLDDPSVVDSLFADGLSIWDEGDPQDLTAKLETHWETRAQMDTVFGLASELEIEPGIIETVELSGTYGTFETDGTVEV